MPHAVAAARPVDDYDAIRSMSLEYPGAGGAAAGDLFSADVEIIQLDDFVDMSVPRWRS